MPDDKEAKEDWSISPDVEKELEACVKDELKKLENKTKKQCAQVEENLKKKQDLQKDKKNANAKKEIKDLDKITKKVIQEMYRERDSANDRLQRMLEQKIPEQADPKALQGLEKKLDGLISKKGLKVHDQIWIMPDLDLKKKKFGLKGTIEF